MEERGSWELFLVEQWVGEARSYWKVGGSPQRLGETEGFIVSSTACVEDVVFGRRRGRKDKKV